jgi:hypothetical protein
LALEPATDDFFGAADHRQAAAERIDIGSVEKVDARRSRFGQYLMGHGFLGLQTECHRAER